MTAKPHRKPQSIMLSCFLIAGMWAGGIATYLAMSNDYQQTAEVTLDSSGNVAMEAQIRLRDRLRGGGDQSPRTQPYEEAPQLVDPSLEGFQFAQPVVPVVDQPVTPPVVAAPVVTPTEPTEPDNPITGALGSLQKLFQGEGNLMDIITIAIAAFAIFGGAQFGGSDLLFKTILGMFGGKANFNDILENKLDSRGSRRRKRRAARSTK